MQAQEKRVAVVTGAGRGIGEATALLLARQGIYVVLVSRSQKELENVANTIQASGGHAMAIKADISNEKAVEGLFTQARGKFGPTDILVNNAGIFRTSQVYKTKVEDWDRIMEINLRGAFLCAREAFKQMMLDPRTGHIVNVGSLSGIPNSEKFLGTAAYSASKYGMIGLTEVLEVEGREFNIRSNLVAPGAVDTKMFRAASNPLLKTNTKPIDVAKVIVEYCSGPRTGEIRILNTNL